MEKVYCINCKHFRMGFSINTTEGECYAPNNIWESDSYLKHHKQPIYIPKWINRKNDCPYFEQNKPSLTE